MKSELETVKVIHIDDTFPWSYEIRDNPEFPDVSILIKHFEEGKMLEAVSIPKFAIGNLIEALESFNAG